MNKFIGRVVTRMQGEDDAMILGCVLDRDVIEADTVYNIEQCFLTGDIKLKKVGKSVIGSGISGYNWAFEQQLLLRRLQNSFFLTEEEYKHHYKRIKGDLNENARTDWKES